MVRRRTMKPDIWMPYYGQDFDKDTKGWSPGDKWAYFAALWAYWCGECKGLTSQDDSELRRICEAESQDWNRIRGKIFGGPDKFKLIDGAWHQRRAAEEYQEAKSTMEAASARAKAGADARWHSGNAQAMPKHMPEQSPLNAPSPSPSPEQPPEQSKTVGASGSRPTTICDEDWLNGLEADSTYAGINVRVEFGKMNNWCQVNRKQPSRRRFVNWLNRVERPIQQGVKSPRPSYAPTLEDVQSMIQEKCPMWQSLDVQAKALAFYQHWNAPKRLGKEQDRRPPWTRNGIPIDWKVELSKQLSTWKGQP